jgi:hypothetical protein
MLDKDILILELQFTFNFDHLVASKLSKYILTSRNRYKVDEALYLETCIESIKNSLSKYDDTKGILIPYIKTGLRYTLHNRCKKYYQEVSLSDEREEFYIDEEDEEEFDVSKLSDEELMAFLNIKNKKATQEDLDNIEIALNNKVKPFIKEKLNNGNE